MTEGHTYKRDQVEKIINSVLEKIKAPQNVPYEALGRELTELKVIIEDLRRQLHSTQADDIGKMHIPSATDELEAVVMATERATETIMESCEKILEATKNGNPELFNQIETCIVQIFEACTFQDITGQRIKKVTGCLKDIETKTASVLKVIQGDYSGFGRAIENSSGDESVSLLNGPALPNSAMLQDDIDRILAEFAAGKPETGHIRLNSYHEGGHILIEVSDDGRGLPLDKIKKKILENNLATEIELAGMSDQQIQQYIFAAGFSTADQVTAVSGRGVGMDVVRTNIEKIGGSIEMNSIEGQGTTFTIKIPLTLAIVSSLIVGIENERFAIPQLDVTELVMTTENGPNRIEMISDTPVFRLRDQILPLICLRNLLGFPPLPQGSVPRYIAVIHVGSYSFGIIVERVFDTEEIVVKPVTSLLKGLPVFSGNTILGDGQVIMILDSAGILKASGFAANSALNRDRKVETVAGIDQGEELPLLLFNAGDDNLKAVLLQNVARLEEVDLANIEYAGGQRVVQYGNTLMPIHLCDPKTKLPASGRRPVIVFKNGDGLEGLMVDRILDITSHRGEYQINSEGELEGSAIIQGRATDIINLFHDRSEKISRSNGGDYTEYLPIPASGDQVEYGARQ